MQNKALIDSKYPDDLIALQLQRYPDHSIAYGSADELQRMSYAQVEIKAQHLAQVLKHHLNLAKGDVVAVLLPRTADFVVCLYAIWKAGLIFLPLTNEASKAYTEHRIRSCNAKCVLVNSKSQHQDIANVSYFSLEKLPSFEPDEIKAITCERDLLDDAYIYCSSGTTSDPKIIVLPYIGIADRVNGIAQEMQIDANNDVLLCSCSFSFDASLTEILLALFTGASLIILPQYARENILQRLPPYLQKLPNPKPTTTILIPSILRFIKSTQEFVGLKKILTTGEKCDIRWLQNLPEWQFWNGYGPTETTFGATTTPIDLNSNFISLHKESMGVTISYRDNPSYSNRYGNRQCEVFVEGSGIGYYQNRPEANKAFTPLTNAGLKRYETGDLVHVKDHNQIEFTRRIDSRRKIFAEQIDLRTIAEALITCDQVQDVELEVEDNTLIAYVQAKNPKSFNAEIYQAHLVEVAKSLGKRHRPSFSFLCQSVINPAPPFRYITTIAKQHTCELLQKYIDAIEAIWKKLLLGNLHDDLLSVVKLDPNATFTELGGSSIAAYPMANEALKLLTAEAQLQSDKREFFVLAASATCSIGKLASFIMVANGIQQRRHLTTENELAIVVINDSSLPLNAKFISKTHPLTISEIIIHNEILKEATQPNNQHLLHNIQAKLHYLLNQIGNLDHKTIIVNADSLCANSQCIDFGHMKLHLNKFRSKAKRRTLVALIKKHVKMSIKQKITRYNDQFIAQHNLQTVTEHTPFRSLMKFNQVIGPPGSGKTASLLATLQQSATTMLPLNMQGCSTIEQAMNRIGFTPAELSLLKSKAIVFLIENFDLKLFKNDSQYEPIFHEWEQAKFIFYSRQEYTQMHRESTPEALQIKETFQQHHLQDNDHSIFGFPDTPIFRHWLGTAIPSASLLFEVLKKWFEYDYFRRHNIAPTTQDLMEFIATLHRLEKDYIQQGVPLCFDSGLSIWHGNKHAVHSLHALKFIEHIKPLLICINAENLLYLIPKEWLSILNSQVLFESQTPTPLPAQPKQSINSLNLISELPKNFWTTVPASVANSVEILSRVTGASNIFMIYPLTGDIPRQYIELKYYLENYNCYALRMPDTSFAEVAEGRSVNLINRATYCVSIIQHIQSHGPYVLLGWSFGSVLAYLIAKQLHEHREVIASIINIDGAPPTSLLDQNPLARVQHVIQDLATARYKLTCAQEITTAIYAPQIAKYTQAFDQAHAVLTKYQDNAIVKTFLADLYNVKANIDAYYQLTKEKGLYPQLPTTMLWLVATQKLPYINDNMALNDWHPFITTLQIKALEYDHFSILNPETYMTINGFINDKAPSLSLEKVAFVKPLEFAKSCKNQHLIEALRRFNLERHYFKDNRLTTEIKFFDDAASTEFESFYQVQRFDSLQLAKQPSDKSIVEKSLFATLLSILNDDTAAVSVIQGMSGSGKTMLLEQLELELLNSFLNGAGAWLPIKIHNSVFRHSNLTTLSQMLRLNLKALIVDDHIKLVFLIDDYDQECVGCINSILISNPGRIIKFMLTSTNVELASEFNSKITVQRYKLLKPNLSSIISYCDQLDQYHVHIRSKRYYRDHFLALTQKYPNVFQLLSTPRNIRIVMPYFRAIHENGLTGELSLFKLSQKLFFSNIKIQITEKNVESRPGLNLEKASTHFTTKLAFAIATGNQNFADFTHDDRDTQTLKTICRINFSYKKAEFEDSLFYHLQLAHYILQKLDKRISSNHPVKLSAFLARIPLSTITLTLDYIADYIRENRSATQLILSNLLLLTFDRSENPTAETIAAASNAISILSRTFHNLGHLDFRRCHFDSANFDGVYFDHAWFDEATFNNIQLSRTSLRHCSLNKMIATNSAIHCHNLDLPTSPSLFRFNHADTQLAYLTQHQHHGELKLWSIRCQEYTHSYQIPGISYLSKMDFAFSKDDQFCILVTEKNATLLRFQDHNTFTTTVTAIDEIDNCELTAIKILITNSCSFYLMKLYDNNTAVFEKWQYQPDFIKLGSVSYQNEKLSCLFTDDELRVSTIDCPNRFGYVISSGRNSLVISQPLQEPTAAFFDLKKNAHTHSHNNIKDNLWQFDVFNLNRTHAIAWDERGLIAALEEDNNIRILNMQHTQSSIYCQQVPFDLGFFALRFNPSTTKLLGATHEALYVWDSQTGNLLSQLPSFHNEVANFCLSHDEKLLASSVLECVNNIIIRQLPQGSQPYYQAKFISLGYQGKCSLWQIANQHFELRVNGSQKPLPISLPQTKTAVTSIHHQNIAYVAHTAVASIRIQSYGGAAQSCKTIPTEHQPLGYLNQRYLALGKSINHSKNLATLCAVYDDKLDQLIELPPHLQTCVNFYHLGKTLFITHDEEGDWLVHCQHGPEYNSALLICLSNIDNSCEFHPENFSDFRFSAFGKTMAASNYLQKFSLYHHHSSTIWQAKVAAFEFTQDSNSLIMIEKEAENNCYLVIYDLSQMTHNLHIKHSTPHLNKAYHIVLSHDDTIIAILCGNGRIYLYSRETLQQLDELVITYLHHNHCYQMHALYTPDHDLIVLFPNYNQWYWRCSKNSIKWQWHQFWSAAPATTPAATHATANIHTQDKILQRQFEFFGVSKRINDNLAIPKQDQQLLIILQRFYDVGIHGKIKSIQILPNASVLSILVDNVYEDQMIYVPINVLQAMIPQFDGKPYLVPDTTALTRVGISLNRLNLLSNITIQYG